MIDLELIRAELGALDDESLFARTREIIRVGHDSRDPDGTLPNSAFFLRYSARPYSFFVANPVFPYIDCLLNYWFCVIVQKL